MNGITLFRRANDLPETPGSRFRSERFFKLSNYWFFGTREGATMGPFDSLELAQYGIDEYVSFVASASPRTPDLLPQESRFCA